MTHAPHIGSEALHTADVKVTSSDPSHREILSGPQHEVPPADPGGGAQAENRRAPQPATGWTASLGLFLVGSIVLIWLFLPEIKAAVRVWSDSETFGHAFFIFPIVLILFFRLRKQLAAYSPRVAPWALAPMGALAIIWLLGDLTSVTIVQQFAFVAIWQCYFLLIFGWRATKTAAFPLGYLYLAVPFGLSAIPLLQDITAQIVVRLLRLSGLPVFLDGYHIEIPSGSFLIAEACSGVRYLIVCIALGILAAHVFFQSWKRKAFFVALSVLVPIVANGLRAYVIVMIAHLSHYTLAVDVDHVVYGFVFLSVVTLCLLGLGVLIRDPIPMPLLPTSVAVDHSVERRGLALSCAIAAMAVVFASHVLSTTAKAPPADRQVILQGVDVGKSWSAVHAENPLWTPDFHGMDAALLRIFRNEEQSVALDVAYYTHQREGSEAVNDLNAISREGSAWKVLQARRLDITTRAGALPVNQIILGGRDQAILVWYWYRIGGEATNSRLKAKLLEAKALITGGERDAAIVAVSAKVADNVDGTAAMLRGFLEQAAEGGGMILQIDMLPVRAGEQREQRAIDLMGNGRHDLP